MMRSMFTGVAGLRTHQTRMDVIGNNIANVNTVGYKASSVTFKEIFSQTIQGASSANPETGRGGTNPLQIGLGVAIASIDNLMTQGAAQTTDNPLDLMINGNAFFIVGDGSGQYFTRAGAFRLDAAGNIVNPSGLKVYGWPATEDPNNPGSQKIDKGKVQPLVIKSPKNMSINPVATSNASFEGNLNPEEGKDGIMKAVDFFDSLGNHYKLEYRFELVDAETNTWEMIPGKEIIRNDNPTSTIALDAADLAKMNVFVTFKSDGTLSSVMDSTGSPIGTSFTIPALDWNTLGVYATTKDITVDMSGTTQYTSKTTVKGMSQNGCTSGELNGFSIGPGGIITGTYSNGNMKILGQIAVANFKNPAGLEKIGDNLFITSPNSGGFDGIGEDPTSGGGSIGGGRLEMSNVDLAREFTDMIITQRGFQANSRVITTSDEMLQELVRLK